MFRLACTLSVLLTACCMTPAQDRTGSKRLTRVYRTAFKVDPRADLRVSGETDWSANRLSLSEGAFISYEFDGGAWVKVEAEAEESAVGDADAEWRIVCPLDRIARFAVGVRQRRKAVRIRLLSYDASTNKYGTVREVNLQGKSPTKLGVEYRYGYVRVTADGKLALTGFLDHRWDTRIGGFQIAATKSALTLTRIHVQRDPIKRRSKTQKEIIAKSQRLKQRSLELRRQGDYREAAKIGEEVVRLSQSADPNSLEHAVHLRNLAYLVQRLGDSGRAEKLYLKAYQLVRDDVGVEHLEFARMLRSVALLRALDLRARAEAESFYDEALNTISDAIGEKNREYAYTLSVKARLLTDLRRHDEAERAFRKAEAILNEVAESNDEFHVVLLAGLGELYIKTYRYEEAADLVRRALKIAAEPYGKEHIHFAPALKMHVRLLMKTSVDRPRIEEASRNLTRIYRKSLGEPSPDYAESLYNLGRYYFEKLNDVGSARPLLEQAVKLDRKHQGKQSGAYARDLHMLGILLLESGQFDDAESRLKESLKIREDVFGKTNTVYADSCTVLGQLYRKMNRFGEAQKYYQEAVDVSRLAAPNSLEHTTTLSNLALFYNSVAEFQRAQQLLEKAIEVSEKSFGKDYPFRSTHLSNLGLVHFRSGNLKKARECLLESLQIEEKQYGENHPNLEALYANLAVLQARNGRRDLAELTYEKACRLNRNRLDNDSVVQSEMEQLRSQHLNRGSFLYRRIANVIDAGAGSNIDPRKVIQLAWRWKGAVTGRQQAYRRVAGNDEVVMQFEGLQAVSRQLSALSRRAPPSAPADAPGLVRDRANKKREKWLQDINTLKTHREALERDIASKSRSFRIATKHLTVENVQSLLPDNAALVDFHAYLHPPQKIRDSWARRYVAFVVRKNAAPKMVVLGSADEIHASIKDFRRLFVEEPPNVEEALAARLAGEKLRREVWEPVEKELNGIRMVIVSPDRDLGTLPFTALPGKAKGSFLLENYQFTMLPMANYLYALEDRRSEQRSSGLLLVGDIDYRAAPGAMLAASSKTPRVTRSRDSDWRSLPGFKDELRIVESIYRKRQGDKGAVQILSRGEATETRFLKTASGFDTLHLVTHGYFAKPVGNDVNSNSPPQMMPGLRSGLVMAGANRPISSESSVADGVLLTLEIETASLPLVDLVVLSACETGLGVAESGEGLIGLQRAFQVAGAKTVVSTLWKVDDAATQQLMSLFYDNYWLKQQSKADALHEAQLWMLNNARKLRAAGVQQPTARGRIGKLAKPVVNREGSARTHPFFWAAFQLSGDWR